ncbi:MAG TPA: hypothetical protein VFG42_24205 [Baekduia sp.]|nr:hypothetical protein [Baekduia sp.]
MRAAVATAAAAAALLAASAGSAAAAPAHWVSPSGFGLYGTNITLTLNGGQPKTCPTFSLSGWTQNSGSQGSIQFQGASNATCGGGELKIWPTATASTTATGYALTFGPSGFGNWDTVWSVSSSPISLVPATVPFTNGTPSSVTFNNTPIGTRISGGGTIAMTGVLQTVLVNQTLAP